MSVNASGRHMSCMVLDFISDLEKTYYENLISNSGDQEFTNDVFSLFKSTVEEVLKIK